jgi:hypothetical protein
MAPCPMITPRLSESYRCNLAALLSLGIGLSNCEAEQEGCYFRAVHGRRGQKDTSGREIRAANHQRIHNERIDEPA